MEPAGHEQARPPGPHTWAEFLALPDDDKRELLGGRFVQVDTADSMHECIVAWPCGRLSVWAGANDAGLVLASGVKVRITERRRAMPDIPFVRPGNPDLGA